MNPQRECMLQKLTGAVRLVAVEEELQVGLVGDFDNRGLGSSVAEAGYNLVFLPNFAAPIQLIILGMSREEVPVGVVAPYHVLYS